MQESSKVQTSSEATREENAVGRPAVETHHGDQACVERVEKALVNADRLLEEVEQLETAMRSLQLASPEVKKQFLQAAAVLITYDHEITITEAEFFRAVAESLDCPVPLFAAGRTTRTDAAE